ncbi:MAG TPA: DegT/DnrJ/EryC1/StrS family aminotransferase, partial [Polyangiaceae bacterium]
TLDPVGVASALSGRTKAIVSVDLFGVVHDLDPLRRAAPEVAVIEDAAQALGAALGAKSAGTLGNMGTFSFFPSKALGAAGDGGACVTDDPSVADRIRRIRNHGSGRTYAWEMRGGNYRLDALQAALLGVKLTTLPARLARRRAIGARLVAAARGAGLTPLVGATSCAPMFAPLALRVTAGGPKAAPSHSAAGRDELLARLRDAGIDARVHYPTTLAASPAFAHYAAGRSFPESERATRELLSVPCHPEMTDEEVTFLERELCSNTQF